MLARGCAFANCSTSFVSFAQNLDREWVIEDGAMIEHLMSRSLSRNQQGCAAGLIWFHVGGLRFSND